MYLAENLSKIKYYFPDSYETLKDACKDISGCRIKLQPTRMESPTLVYEGEAGQVYIHSRYNPVEESERLLEQYSNIDSSMHVLFYGIGLGYHIEAFARRFPDISFSLYEINKEVMYYFLSHRQLGKLPMDKMQGIYLEARDNMNEIIDNIQHKAAEKVAIITLPSYSRLFPEKHAQFLECFKTAAANKKINTQANAYFQKHWTINSMKNFTDIINSQSLLQDKREYFRGRPAIIAAAGPSLQDEIENLKHIKDTGLAYIFSAGSAINALLESGIHPHFACTYDPGPHNYKVFERIINENINDIPLIYGSSAYHEIIEKYPGKKLHVITNQDTVSPYYLRRMDGEKLDIIEDSTTITIVLLQLLFKLGCDPIILVGQNFAYRGSMYYAGGISYESRPAELSDSDTDNLLMAEDVNGGQVYTSNSFNYMRWQMESYIRRFDECNIINTTKGGARIEGTSFLPLGSVIENMLKEKAADDSWAEENGNNYDPTYMLQRNQTMNSELTNAYSIFNEIMETTRQLKELADTKCEKRLGRALAEFENKLKKMVSNDYFNTFIKPMNRKYIDEINRGLLAIRSEANLTAKACKIVENYSSYFEECRRDLIGTTPIFFDMTEEIIGNDIKVMSFTIKVS